MKRIRSYSKGALLVEVIIVSAIILTFMLVLMSAFSLYLKLSLADKHRIQAAALAEESLEAVRFYRDVNWNTFSNFSVDTDYYLTFSNSTWNISTQPVPYTEGLFERKIRFENAYRDAGNKLVTSGGTIDTETRLVKAIVSWRENSATTTKTLSTYLAKIK